MSNYRTGERSSPLQPIENADASVADTVAPYRKTPVIRTVSFVSKLGDQPPLRALCGVMFLVGAVGRSSRLMKASLRMLAAHTLATAAKNFVKNRIDRRRPDARRTSDDTRLTPGTSSAKEDTSFPSGHSAGAIAVACAFAREFPQHKLTALTIGGTLSVAQITRGKHYPSDVAAGTMIGIASEALLNRVLKLVPVPSSLSNKPASSAIRSAG